MHGLSANPRPPSMKIQPLGQAVENSTLVRLVRRQLIERIGAQFHPRLRLPPIRQIADEFEVSVGTANQAIKDLVNAGVLVSRPRRGTTLAPGCKASDLKELLRGAVSEQASRRRGGRGPEIQVMVSATAEAMIVEMAESFARAITGAGGQVLFAEYPGSRSTWSGAAQGDATVMFQPAVRANPGIHWDAAQPLLTVSTQPLAVDRSYGYDLLTVDEEQGGFLAGRRARDGGWTTACFVGRCEKEGPRLAYESTSQRRLDGFERGFGAAVPAAHRLRVGAYDIDQGAAIVAEYVKLDPLPQMVFCGSDDVAIGFMLGAKAHGLTAGKYYQLIGFDRQERAMDVPGGPVTTVEVPRVEMGQRGAELIISRLSEPAQAVRRVLLGCRLFDGNTFFDH